nr:MAG TPA: hypothetical protein [Caudoviricetes sp.]
MRKGVLCPLRFLHRSGQSRPIELKTMNYLYIHPDRYTKTPPINEYRRCKCVRAFRACIELYRVIDCR